MLDAATVDADVIGAALAGLTAARKTLPPSLLYDAAGIALFGAITRLPEYTLTRTERALLAEAAGEIVALAEPGSVLVEYGASDEAKALALIDAAPGRLSAYVPIDVAADALDAVAQRLARSHPDLFVHPSYGDFLRPVVLPASVAGRPRFGFFPGSTIGNFDPAGAHGFLLQAAATLGRDAWLVVGADLCQDPALLIPAYDDAAGVTAAFNLNLLHRLNREAAADFDAAAFRHRAVWNALHSRIEMHLESLRDQQVHVAGTTIDFAAGETIHTENSTKYSVDALGVLAGRAGWRSHRVWTDAVGLFAIHALRCEGRPR